MPFLHLYAYTIKSNEMYSLINITQVQSVDCQLIEALEEFDLRYLGQ